MLKILIILLPIFSLSQTLDSIFLKQPPEIRGYITLKDSALQVKVKKIIRTNYMFDEETGKKNSSQIFMLGVIVLNDKKISEK